MHLGRTHYACLGSGIRSNTKAGFRSHQAGDVDDAACLFH